MWGGWYRDWTLRRYRTIKRNRTEKNRISPRGGALIWIWCVCRTSSFSSRATFTTSRLGRSSIVRPTWLLLAVRLTNWRTRSMRCRKKMSRLYRRIWIWRQIAELVNRWKRIWRGVERFSRGNLIVEKYLPDSKLHHRIGPILGLVAGIRKLRLFISGSHRLRILLLRTVSIAVPIFSSITLKKLGSIVRQVRAEMRTIKKCCRIIGLDRKTIIRVFWKKIVNLRVILRKLKKQLRCSLMMVLFLKKMWVYGR